MDKDKNGLEIYHQRTYESDEGTPYKLGIFIPFEEGSPQPPELWVKSGNKKTVFQATGYHEATWVRLVETNDEFRFIDIVQESLKLTKETSLFLVSIWKDIYQKWQSLEEKARKETPASTMGERIKILKQQD